jgi:hypothetical protein
MTLLVGVGRIQSNGNFSIPVPIYPQGFMCEAKLHISPKDSCVKQSSE